MKQGALFFDETADRYDIRFDLADYYGGLRCGARLEGVHGLLGGIHRRQVEADPYGVRRQLVSCGCPRRGLERLTGADLSGAAQAADAHFLCPKAAQHISPRKEDGKCKMKSTKKSLPYP